MTRIHGITMAAAAALLAGCGSEGRNPVDYGPNPTLPEPSRGLLPAMNIADPAPWGDLRPAVPQGYAVTAIATDLNPGTSPVVSLRLAMTLACTHFRLTPEEALRGATRHAALALGLHDRGRLAPGYRADLAVLTADFTPRRSSSTPRRSSPSRPTRGPFHAAGGAR